MEFMNPKCWLGDLGKTAGVSRTKGFHTFPLSPSKSKGGLFVYEGRDDFKDLPSEWGHQQPLSQKKKTLSYFPLNSGCLGILRLVYYNPHI